MGTRRRNRWLPVSITILFAVPVLAQMQSGIYKGTCTNCDCTFTSVATFTPTHKPIPTPTKKH